VQLRGTALWLLRNVTRLATTAAAEDEKGVITWGWRWSRPDFPAMVFTPGYVGWYWIETSTL